MQPAISDEPTMVKIAEADVRRRFPTVDRRHIEAAVASSVHRWAAKARIKTFVPILAARDARAEIDHELTAAFLGFHPPSAASD